MSVRKTSIETYIAVKESGLISEKRMRVYNIFYDNGNLTGSQVSELYKIAFPSNSTSETIRNRITELVRQGVVEELGLTKCPYNHRKVTLFGLTDNKPVKLTLPKTIKVKTKEILEKIKSYGKTYTLEGTHQKTELIEIYRMVENISKK